MTRLRDRAWARELLGVCEGTLASMIHRRQVPFVRISARVARFDEAELLAWVEAKRVPASEKPADGLAEARAEIRRRRGAP